MGLDLRSLWSFVSHDLYFESCLLYTTNRKCQLYTTNRKCLLYTTNRKCILYTTNRKCLHDKQKMCTLHDKIEKVYTTEKKCLQDKKKALPLLVARSPLVSCRVPGRMSPTAFWSGAPSASRCGSRAAAPRPATRPAWGTRCPPHVCPAKQVASDKPFQQQLFRDFIERNIILCMFECMKTLNLTV